MSDKKNTSPTGPFLKWAGGKGQLLEQFQAFLPDTLSTRHYVEPFVGSGAVFFHVAQNLLPASCTLLDINPDLINVYCEVRDHVEDVIAALTQHKAFHNAQGITDEARKAYYYGVRAQEPTDLLPAERAARFIYLNKTCFNGLHRLNSKGQFNVPIGSYRQPTIFDANHLRKVSGLLQGVTIEVCPFQECERYIGDNAFVYFDPPYEPLSRTSSFTSYTKEDFSQENQRELRDLVRRISPRCQWMLSNSTADIIEELYSGEGFYKHYVMASRAINSVAKGRSKIRELVVTNYDTEEITTAEDARTAAVPSLFAKA